MHEETEISSEMKHLEGIIWAFREKKEEKYNWETDKTTFLGKCRDFSKKLTKVLKNEGYENAQLVCGQYTNFSQDYLERDDLGYGPVEFIPEPKDIFLKVYRTLHGFYIGLDPKLIKKKKKLNLGKIARFIEEGYFDAQHCWVVLNDEYIIDVTVDQFHPNDPDPFRVKITDIHHPGFKPYGDGSLEPKPLEFPQKASNEEKIKKLEERIKILEKEKKELLLKLCVSTTEMV